MMQLWTAIIITRNKLLFDLPILDLLFRQTTTFIKVCVDHVFRLQTLQSLDFSKIYQLKGLQPQKQSPQELL